MFQQALDTISKQVLIRPTYDNFIGGKFVAPVEGRYFENLIRRKALLGSALQRRRHRSRARRRPQGQGSLGQDPGGRAIGHLQ